MTGIIVGVDESPCSAAALRWAVDHAASAGESVTAVLAWGYLDQHQLTPDRPFDPSYGSEMATKVLETIVVRAVGEDHHVTCLPVCDLPARALLDASEGASLLVVGARGMGGFRGLLLGSVSRKVLHHAVGPVAVIRETDRRPDGPIVVGVDGSEPSQRALEWALANARDRQRPLVALRAWHLPYTGHEWMGVLPAATDLAADARAEVDRQLGRAEGAGLVTATEVCVVHDQPSAALLAAGKRASVLVVGSRGHGALTGALLGSVSDQVSQHATCPVVVVP
jgi:nucleotide-binding universal stress UspA family protein